MNPHYSSNAFSQLTHHELSKKRAIHEAGHALAIYLGTRRKPFSPVFFQLLKKQRSHFQLSRSLRLLNDKWLAQLEDDRLIQTLPLSIEKAAKVISSESMQAYEYAFEAEVISLLVGPLAEAKYVALRDGEMINPRLVNLHALHNYGGSADLEIVNEYLQWFVVEGPEREKKSSELFLQAFRFIDDQANWLAITVLATYILADCITIIECEEVMPYLIPRYPDSD